MQGDTDDRDLCVFDPKALLSKRGKNMRTGGNSSH